jgi:hypothetical protein
MTDLQLSDEERHVVALFANMPPDAKVRFPTWFVELMMPPALAVAGLIMGYNVLVGAAFGGLLAVHAFRVLRQFKFAKLLQSICSKVQAHLAAQSVGA